MTDIQDIKDNDSTHSDAVREILFFQAENGIPDTSVTGVQTCALPISAAAEAPVDLSYLSDTVVSLRYFEAYGEVKQAITVVKKRSGAHEKTIREFKLMSGKGIVIGEPLTQFQGVLTGVPIFRGSEKQILKDR